MDVILRIFQQVVNSIMSWIASESEIHLAFEAVILFLLSAIIIRLMWIIVRRNESETALYAHLMKSLDLNESIDENITNILRYISSMMVCEGYALYVEDEVKGHYYLRTQLNLARGNPQVGPSYAGLFAHKAEHFEFAGIYDKNFYVDHIDKVTTGDVPLIFVPLLEGKAFILFGPVKSLPRRVKKRLEALRYKLNPVLNALLVVAEYKECADRKEQSDKVFQNLSHVINDKQGILDVLLDLSVKALKADAGILAVQENMNWLIHVNRMDEEVATKLRKDPSVINRIFEAGTTHQVAILTPEHKIAIFGEGHENFTDHSLISMSFTETLDCGFFMFALQPGSTFKEKEIQFIELMIGRVQDVITNEIKFRKMSEGYIDILITLSDTVDSMKPSSVGYSELVYRYSMILARELGMTESEKTDLAIAAYLSNIGIIGISEDLFSKKGRYDPAEFERMKLHADAGAKIIEATMGNLNAASIVRHHHERMDGMGYPSGLRGHDIPLGSRIIAVIQTFLAKIISREYRDPLSFYEAMYSLRQITGTQLDGDVVEAMVNWVERKRAENKDLKMSLGPCWEMRCTPSSICKDCKAYGVYDRACWTVEQNNCAQHGNVCKTCFVRTEYFERFDVGER